MKFAYSIVALVAAAVVQACDSPSSPSPPFTNCAPADAISTIDSFTLDPYPMCRSQKLCITATGVLSEPITSGALVGIVATLFGSPVVTATNMDLCALLADQGHPCPVPVTVITLTACGVTKASIPVNIGAIMTVSALNGDGKTLFCQTTPSAMVVDC